MKFVTVKKLICIMLSVIMLLSMPLSALAVEIGSSPVIYIGDMTENTLYVNPNKNGSEVALDINSSGFTGSMTNIVFGLLLSALEDTDTGLTPVANGIKAIMEPIKCAPNGTSAASNVGVWEYYQPIAEHKADSVYSKNLQSFVSAADGYVTDGEVFFFSYDWRLDPLDSAEKLKDFIDHVETVTGESKVSLLAVGYGGVVVNSYFHEHKEHAVSNIASTLLYNCSVLGNAVIGDFMKGRIARIASDEDSLSDIVSTINGAHRGEAFFDFLDDDSMGIFSGIFENLLGEGALQTLVSRLALLLGLTIAESQDAHKMIGKAYNTFALNKDKVIYDDFLREYLRNMPGLWALVPEKDLDEAIEFMFGDEFINSELNQKIANYRTVIDSTAKTIKDVQYAGVNVTVVANYGLQLIPLTISLDDVSDGIESVKYSSLGAVTTDNSKETGHFNNCINANHNHVSPDNDINAAYCILPENTWFIKDVPHGDMTKEPVADFLVWLLFGFSQRHVRENLSYTQYMSYSEYSKKLSPYTTPGSDEGAVKYGDVDMNGTISAADARLALRISVGLETVTKEVKILADVDGNGTVGAADARLILRYSVGLTQGFPV